jgi:hypothetical protein
VTCTPAHAAAFGDAVASAWNVQRCSVKNPLGFRVWAPGAVQWSIVKAALNARSPLGIRRWPAPVCSTLRDNILTGSIPSLMSSLTKLTALCARRCLAPVHPCCRCLVPSLGRHSLVRVRSCAEPRCSSAVECCWGGTHDAGAVRAWHAAADGWQSRRVGRWLQNNLLNGTLPSALAAIFTLSDLYASSRATPLACRERAACW